MNTSVFYSWQSDRPEKLCRYFIRDAAKKALKNIGAANNLELSPRLDHDTKGEGGMPEITETIFRKIQQSSYFIADMTFVGKTENGKYLPNPNVLLELGFAARAIGWDRIICIMNEEYGSPDQQIFNIRHRRFPIGYTLNSESNCSTELPILADKITNALSTLLSVKHNAVTDTISSLDIYSLTFLKQHGKSNIIVPPNTGRFSMGAPAGTLDTPGFNRAVNRLLDQKIIECRIEKQTGRFVYGWTYLGILTLNELGWR